MRLEPVRVRYLIVVGQLTAPAWIELFDRHAEI